MSSAARSQSTKKSCDAGSRYTKRALFAGLRGSANTGEYNARAIRLAASMSCLALRTHAGASVMASSIC